MRTYSGHWEISVIPENKPALAFWRKVIAIHTQDNFIEEIKEVGEDNYQLKRVILSFKTCNKSAT